MTEAREGKYQFSIHRMIAYTFILDLTKALEIEPSNKSVKDELSSLPAPTPKKQVSVESIGYIYNSTHIDS